MIDALRQSLRELCSCLSRRSVVISFSLGAAVALPVYFVWRTGLVWEDFLITYRYSENLVRGNGLVYWPGERVYGFTSPLNTLLPALFAALLRASDYAAPLLLFRAISLVGLVFGALAVTSVLTRGHGGSSARFLAGSLFPLAAVLEIKTTAFAMSGQEAGLLLGFLGPAFAAACLGWPRFQLLGGLLWAGLMYTRPDAFIYIGAIAIAALVFEAGSRKPLFVSLCKSALLCALLYLPWFLFTWAYYGSPVPHTVIAKNGVYGYQSNAFALLAPLSSFLQMVPVQLCRTLAAIYDPLTSGPWGWPKWLHDVITILESVAVLYWLAPTQDRIGRMASLVSFFLLGYLTFAGLLTPPAPWYYPPLAFMSIVSLVCAIGTVAEQLKAGFARFSAAGAMLTGLICVLGFIFFLSLPPLRIKQDVIEGGNRRRIGLWLKDHVPKGETVYLEPLGYIGYFSQCRMLDWPGLVSPVVVAARRKIGQRGENTWANEAAAYTWPEVAEAIKPDWLVARPHDVDLIRQNTFLSENYELQQVFDVGKDLEKFGKIPGLNITFPESAFGIYRRKLP